MHGGRLLGSDSIVDMADSDTKFEITLQERLVGVWNEWSSW